MNGFYNRTSGEFVIYSKSCHTVPNERLLQPKNWRKPLWSKVVIPSRMNGFYNCGSAIITSCTSVVIPSRMNGFYNCEKDTDGLGVNVVIPSRMNGFYNMIR